MTVTPDEERRYGLSPLPETPFCGLETAKALNAAYEAQRAEYRRQNPGRDMKREGEG
jgi:hypothetical protein